MEVINALYSGDDGSVLVKFSLIIVKPRSYAKVVSGARVGGSGLVVGLVYSENPGVSIQIIVLLQQYYHCSHSAINIHFTKNKKLGPCPKGLTV